MKDELRDDAIEVFPDKYPDEGDVLGWLKIYENDFIFGSMAEQAGEQIKTLTEERDSLKSLLADFKGDVMFRIGTASPYRQVAKAYQERIVEALKGMK